MSIKNGDLPAMPSNVDAQTLSCTGRLTTVEAHYQQMIGMTKREMFAMAAMQGLLSKHGYDDYKAESIAEYAVNQADALLAELERTK